MVDNGTLSQSHRSRWFADLLKDTQDSVRALLEVPADYEVLFTASASEAMERTVQNLVKDESFHFVNGVFSGRIKNIANGLGRKAQSIDVPSGEGFSSFDMVPSSAELVTVVQSETSTGVWTDLTPFYDLHEQHLIAVDCVSSVPYGRIRWEKTDVVFFSVQKGFGLPAGLGVMIISPRAIAQSKEIVRPGMFHSFLGMKEKSDSGQTEETPNVLGIALLGRVAKDLSKRGLDALAAETDKKACILYALAADSAYPVQKKEWRSPTTIVIATPGGSKVVIEAARERGFAVASGYGKASETMIRIGNFPATTVDDTKALARVLVPLL
jgi:phosphoserine aminotransferase